jgi:hypothetical protein
MKKSRLRTSLAAGACLVIILGCTVPGFTPASVAVPTADAVLLSTMVAGTVSAARTQTAGPPAGTSEVDAAVAETPVPVPGMAGTNLEKTSDGSTKYKDYDGGFEVVLPVGWLAVRPNTDEFYEVLANEGADNQMLHDQMTVDQAGYEASVDRLYSYPLRPDIQENVIFGFSKLTWDPEDSPVPLDNDAMGELVSLLEGQGGIPGFRASVAQLSTNVNGVSVIEIGGPFVTADGQGEATPFYATLIFFKPTPTSLARMTFTIVRDYQEPISADLKSVIESIKLLEQ